MKKITCAMADVTKAESQSLSPLELVRAAVLAPTPDNNQPWRFVSRNDQLCLFLDPERSLPSDVNAMFDLIGLGSAVENVCIAARQMGYQPHVTYGPAPTGSADVGSAEPVATITFAPGGETDPLFPHLATRCTCRRLYSTRPVAEEPLKNIALATGEFPDVQLDWITDRSRIRAFARLIASSDRFRFEYEPFHNEIFRQLRFTAAEAEQTRDGLDVRTMELPPGAAAIFKRLRPWRRMKWVCRFGLVRVLTMPSALAVYRSGALGAISLPEPTSRGFLDGGRAFQRVWLAAQAEGLALQPLGSLSIFLAQMEQLEGRNLTAAHRRLSESLGQRFRELVPAAQGRTLQILFRLGSAAAPSVRSLRRNAEEVIRCE